METVKSSSHSKDSKKHSSSRGSESKKSSRHRHRSSSRSSEEESQTKRKHDAQSDSDSDHKSSRRHKDSNGKKHRSDEKSKSKSAKNEDTSAGGDISLSIEETNKLREKLGLKPLSINENKSTNDSKTNESGRKTYIDKDTNQEFEHKPATNMAEIREQKELREKLKEQREKRQLMEKLRQAKGIADSDEEEDASNWLIKQKQKEEARKKAKLLEEMDQQFQEEDAPRRAPKTGANQKQKNYTENDLSGMRVEHDQNLFKEGQEIILTLKDKYILKGTGDNADVDDEDDTLVNVNILDDERAMKNIENKKKKPDYQAYDEFDEDGLFKERGILDKYNEELQGEKKKSFKLGSKGKYDASDDKYIQRLNEEHKARAIKIEALNELKLATDYMTPQEMEKFKKPKKVRKVLRKSKMIKADDLLATAPESAQLAVKPRIKKEETIDLISVKKEPEETSGKKAENGKVSLKDIDFGFRKESSDEDGEFKEEPDADEEEDDDDISVNKLKENELEELKKVIEEENNVLDELHSVLSKTRQRVTSSILNSNNLIKQDLSEESESRVVEFDSLKTIVEDEDNRAGASLTLDSLSEFCRNVGTTSTSTKTEKKPIIEEDEDEEEMEVEQKQTKPAKDDSSEDEDELLANAGEMKEEEENEEDKEGFELLEEEPTINRGLASCLQLAFTKGYIEKEKSKQNAKVIKASIEAINYTVEEKNYYDIDDKYNRNRDRFSGPLSDFQEKPNYKPDVKLDYIDEKGHSMNEKEAFRYLSHRFHGKGSGKKKTEKQQKKIKELEAMNKMSSIDTPLNTVALLVEKQKKLQQPYVVLSASKKQDQVTLHKR